MPTKTDNPLDELADEGAERIMSIVDSMPEQVDPMGEQKLTREEQLERYRAMRDDPQAWRNLLDEHGLKETIRYAKTMQALEAAHGKDDV